MTGTSGNLLIFSSLFYINLDKALHSKIARLHKENEELSDEFMQNSFFDDYSAFSDDGDLGLVWDVQTFVSVTCL